MVPLMYHDPSDLGGGEGGGGGGPCSLDPNKIVFVLLGWFFKSSF